MRLRTLRISRRIQLRSGEESIACQSWLHHHTSGQVRRTQQGVGKQWARREEAKEARTALALARCAAAGSLLRTRCSCRLGGFASSGRAIALTLCDEQRWTSSQLAVMPTLASTASNSTQPTNQLATHLLCLRAPLLGLTRRAVPSALALTRLRVAARVAGGARLGRGRDGRLRCRGGSAGAVDAAEDRGGLRQGDSQREKGLRGKGTERRGGRERDCPRARGAVATAKGRG